MRENALTACMRVCAQTYIVRGGCVQVTNDVAYTIHSHWSKLTRVLIGCFPGEVGGKVLDLLLGDALDQVADLPAGCRSMLKPTSRELSFGRQKDCTLVI